MGSPSALQNVDDRGYVFVTEAADCQIVTTMRAFKDTDGLTALPATPLVGRRRIYVKNNTATNLTLYVGGADVTAGATGNGYPIAMGDEIILDITDGIILYGITDAVTNLDVRVLELS